MVSEVELVSLSKRFGKGVVALDQVSLTVSKGEFVALLGPSGCGKTTLLRIIAGFIQPTSGEIRIQGRNFSSVPVHRRNTAMVFQNYSLFPHMTVWKNVAFGLEVRRVPKQKAGERIKQALELVKLSGFDDRYPRQLSGGQQQRVALARALITEPAVLLLDEPLSNLDARLRQEMREEIRELQRHLNITTIFVTHDQQEALSTSDRIVVLDAGRVEQVGSPTEVYSRPATRFVGEFIGDANLLEGTVEETKGRFLRIVNNSAGVRLRGLGSGLSRGDKAVLLVHPESVHIVKTGASEVPANTIPATIEAITYLGGRISIRTMSSLGQIRLSGETRELSAPQVTEEVTLGWNENDCVVVRP